MMSLKNDLMMLEEIPELNFYRDKLVRTNSDSIFDKPATQRTKKLAETVFVPAKDVIIKIHKGKIPLTKA